MILGGGVWLLTPVNRTSYFTPREISIPIAVSADRPLVNSPLIMANILSKREISGVRPAAAHGPRILPNGVANPSAGSQRWLLDQWCMVCVLPNAKSRARLPVTHGPEVS